MARETKIVNDVQDESTAELQAQIAQLKEDIAAIAATLTDMGSRKINQVRQDASDAYNDAYEQGEDALNSLKSSACSVEQQVTDYVQERPVTSLALAAAFGYLVAALTRR
ncbi:DUF883 family protein [Pseudochrobactrum asaccharolyticum]|jgi:ElaB/YqjD/DUF883 family membrane-anchored ribosome-binding protein|uniref:ElaB/YqjD/DUF883 family membrane-anchored ribosome-binding protein n=1 Tax=Pseudochrobactrum asaccharolyticum TaxID=354351 RepID=A0A366DT53_9HYPH|nr:DUF883 family protein [Pseudochrobactrum asaccharolyticum]MBX8801722.1 DUF883 family protein [Ochrobactrum sp. MR28]MBX8816769.1 DUF883 family protein [Ochrobactrum sp. MR31]RBO93095.1 ElaB/YqjD/DUF883 family membrane-anchored ribosome-binding protein [Pseudochrobactrum asaccharolyticum]